MRLWMEATNTSNISLLIVGVTSHFAMMWVKWVSGKYCYGLTMHLLSVSMQCDVFKYIRTRLGRYVNIWAKNIGE